MSSEQRQKDSGTHRLSAVEGSLASLAREATRGWAIRCDITYGTLYARTLEPGKADCLLTGTGHGFIERRKMSAEHLARFLESASTSNPKIRRGPEEAVWPSRFVDQMRRGP